MDQKSWVWKKRSVEKSLASQSSNVVRQFLEESETDLSHKALSDCSSKQEEAVAGWERAKREAMSLKDVEKVSQQKAASEQRISNLEAALKECTQQLRFVREEQEKRIHSAITKTSQELAKTQIALQEKLAEATKKITILDSKNTKFYEALSEKDRVIEELSKQKSQAEANANALELRLESTEKKNASLKYEIRVLEKELDIRNEEAEVNRRTADIAQKQQKESVKRVTKLESECQRLRLLVQRRLPGPTALTRMKNEVGMDRVDARRRRSNPSLISSMEFDSDAGGDTPSKRINFLTEQLLKMEEENRSLRYELENSFRGQMNQYVANLSDLGTDDRASCAGSTSALISELENLKNGKQLGVPSRRHMRINSEMNLMDDFAEMEKLAIVHPPASPHHSSEEGNAVTEKDASAEKTNDEKLQLNVSVHIGKILELQQGMNLLTQHNGKAESFSGYTVRVFQWKGDELNAILHDFFETCNDLLNGKTDVEQFAQIVASSLEWVVNHCFTIQDVSSIKDAIKKRFDWDETKSESGEDSSSTKRSAESTRVNIQTGDNPFILMASPLNGHNNFNHMEGKQSKTEEANNTIMEAANSGSFTTQHQNSKARQKIPNLVYELENTNSALKGQDKRCNDQKTQLKIETSKEDQDDGKSPRKQLRNDSEISTAAEKLAECQETLLNLGKQLKAMASPRDAALFHKVKSIPADHVITNASTPRRIARERLSLQDKMIEEDNDQNGVSPGTTIDAQSGNYSSVVSNNVALESGSRFTDPNGADGEADTTEVASMAIVPCKKIESRSFLKKLFLWKKKGNRKKTKHLMLS